MSKHKKFRSLKEVYMTGQTYKREESKPVQHRRLTEMYSEVYKPKETLLHEGWKHLTKGELNKKRPGQDRVQTFVDKIRGKETFTGRDGESIGPLEVDPNWLAEIERDGVITVDAIPLIDGSTISINTLAKTNEFGGKGGTAGESTTHIKEGLVTLFFANGGTGAGDPTVTTENYKTVVESLRLTLAEKVNVQPEPLAYEYGPVQEELDTYLTTLLSKPKILAKDLRDLNQPLSQAVTMITSYKGWIPTRATKFEEVRKWGKFVSKLEPDKWNPGDIYLINPSPIAMDEINGIFTAIQQNPDNPENLHLLNSLFVQEWGDTNGHIVSVSLKQARAQHGKAKDYLKARIPDEAKGQPYNVGSEVKDWTPEQFIEDSKRLRQNITDIINTANEVDDIEIKYKPEPDTPQSLADIRRVQGKYASLRVIEFLLSSAGKDKIDDVIVGAIGFAMSLTGVNPVFFKLQANNNGEAVSPSKFNAGGSVALHPSPRETEPIIHIEDVTANNAIKIHANVEAGEKVVPVILQSRTNGYASATLELNIPGH